MFSGGEPTGCREGAGSGGKAAHGADVAPQCGLPSCEATGTKRCTACKVVYYCSQAHQRSHWKVHKVECRGTQAKVKRASKGGAAGGADTASSGICGAPKGKAGHYSPAPEDSPSLLPGEEDSLNKARRRGENKEELMKDAHEETLANVTKLSVRELKQALAEHRVSIEDCFEKIDLQKKLCQAIGATSTRVNQLRASKVCLSCGSTGAMSYCNGCHFAQYCNEICLRDHWREHATTCNGSRRAEGPESRLKYSTPSTQPLLIRAIRLWLAAGIELGSKGSATPHQILVAAALEQPFDRALLDDVLRQPEIDVNARSLAVAGGGGADVHGGLTVVRLAAFFGCEESLAVLASTPGVDVNIPDGEGCCPLFAATTEGHPGCVKILLGTPGIEVNKLNFHGETALFGAAQMIGERGKNRCAVIAALLADPRVDVNLVRFDGMTFMQGLLAYLASHVDHVGAAPSDATQINENDPMHALALLLQSGRLTRSDIEREVALIRQTTPSRKDLKRLSDRVDGGLSSQEVTHYRNHYRAAHLMLPVLEAELKGEHRWCAWCLKLTPDRDLDLCARCHQVGYCRPLNKRQLEGGHYSEGMPAKEQDRRNAFDCQRLHWKAKHKHECAGLAADWKRECAAAAVGKGGRSGGGGGGGGSSKKKGKKKGGGRR